MKYTHCPPLFDLAPQWDWATRDGAAAIEILSAYDHVTVFYGHIHQEHHFVTGKINHHAAKSLVFPLPVTGSQEKRTPLPWGATTPFKGLGFRAVETEPRKYEFEIQEFPVVKVQAMRPSIAVHTAILLCIATAGLALALRAGADAGDERVIKIVAKKFNYTPDLISLEKGEPVTLEFTSLDFTHGFKVPDLGLRVDLPPGHPVLVHLVPEKTGRFLFLCDNFCGSGHEEMNGVIVVTE